MPTRKRLAWLWTPALLLLLLSGCSAGRPKTYDSILYKAIKGAHVETLCHKKTEPMDVGT